VLHKAYAEVNKRIERELTEKNLITLPKQPLRIRFMDDAESKARPVPQLLPPPIVGNTGQRPEFVVPTSSSGKLPFDDFSYRAAIPGLLAHEGRPGHDLQFSAMLDNGVSLIRARYAFNSANVEGWGLYAEDVAAGAYNDEERLAFLQMRLWRIARAFLDPQLQAGVVDVKGVVKFYTKRLGISKAMAELDARRFAFDNPGQATSYYYGYLKIVGMKERARSKLKASFTEKCFNDAVVSYGMMPLDTLAKRLDAELHCS
jgi:uncharacterized protein (DUF885 family)